jgi:eukaryotic-like serine/threonine-protein kinase
MKTGIVWCPHCKSAHLLGTKICPATAKTIDRNIHNLSTGDQQHALIGTLVGGKYHISRLIGRGATAEVFEAENTTLHRAVAVKVLRSTTAAGVVAPLAREAKLVAAIQHPNICDVYDVGTLVDGSSFIVLERLSGETFDVQLRRSHRLPFAGVADIFSQILSGLQAAHGANIVHRDLKPKNVFLVDRLGCAPIVKLLDFGFAKDLSGRRGWSITPPGMAVGTVPYMAPEQLRGEPASARSDLFAVGIMLYETLTGKHPFRGDTLVELKTSVLRCEPTPPEELRPDLPRSAAALLARALARDPAERWGTALAFQKALREAFATIARPWNESIPPDTPDSQSLRSLRDQ